MAGNNTEEVEVGSPNYLRRKLHRPPAIGINSIVLPLLFTRYADVAALTFTVAFVSYYEWFFACLEVLRKPIIVSRVK